MSGQFGQVWLIGAGPGDPGLLTVRAAEVLQQADLVVFDKLVPERMLDFARPEAIKVCVTHFHAKHPERWPHVIAGMIEAAREGKRVARLKGGDPLIFGRGGEEAEALREEGIPYEIIPGITAALGAGAYSEIPLTHREMASAIAFITGHETPGKPGSLVDWPALARFPGTLAVYMGTSKIIPIIEELLANGMPADTPSAMVMLATTGDQRTVTAPLVQLARVAADAGLQAPAMVLIGSVVTRRPLRSWFEFKPLHNRHVLVTRPRGQAGELMRQLELQGAVPFLLPAVEILEPDDFRPLDAVLARLAEFDWLVFTSANGVHGFFRRLLATRDLRALGRLRIACIGPKTAEVLRTYHLRADLVPEKFDSEHLAATLGPLAAGGRVLLARADRGRDVLRQALSEVAIVEQVTVYRQVDGVDSRSAVFPLLRRGEIGYVLLTSSNIARAFLAALDETTRQKVHAGHIKLVAISEVTAADVRALGFPVAAVAEQATSESLIAALIALAATESL